MTAISKNALTKAEADLGVAQAGYREARAGLPSHRRRPEAGSRIRKLRWFRQKLEWKPRKRTLKSRRPGSIWQRQGPAEVQATYAKTVKDLDRMKALIAKDEISQQQYDAAVTAFDSARAAVESSKATIQEAQSTMASAQARVVQARSAIGLAESDLENAKSGASGSGGDAGEDRHRGARVAQAKAAIELVRTKSNTPWFAHPSPAW